MDQDPTVEQIVDCIMALDCGQSCDVKLNPRITRIANMEWLLPICTQQFGTAIDIHEHAEGAKVVLTITATATRRHTTRPTTDRDQLLDQREEGPPGVADDQLVAVA